MVYQGTGYGYTLFLTTRQLVGLMLGTVGQSHKLQQLFSPFASLFGADTCNIGRNHDIFDGCEFRQQLVKLEYKADMAVTKVAQFLL